MILFLKQRPSSPSSTSGERVFLSQKMAENKKGFMLYADQKELFDALPNEKAGELIKLIYSYINDENPEIEDQLLKVAFIPIKQTLKRDLKKWESRAETNRLNGQLGGRPKNPKKPSGLNGLNEKPKKPDSVSVSVKDSDSDSDRASIKKLAPKKIKYAEFVSLLESEYNKLVEKYGKAKTERMIEILDNYKGSKGAKYKSDYRAILNWVVNRIKEEQNGSKTKSSLTRNSDFSEKFDTSRAKFINR